MDTDKRRTPIYKIIAFAWAGLLVVLAFVWVLVYRPVLKHEGPDDRLAAAMAARFPGCDAQVTHTEADALRVSLKVSFDPTMDADQAQHVFGKALEIAGAQRLTEVKTLKIELVGTNLDGHATSAAQTFDYEPASK